MNIKLSAALVLFTLLTCISPAFAEDGSQESASEPTLSSTNRITQEGAIEFPFPELTEASWGTPSCRGSMAPNQELVKGYMEKSKGVQDFNMPTSFDICYVPVREGSKLRLSGVIVAYDYDGKFISREMFMTLLSSDEVFSKRIFAAGRYYNFELKFSY